MSLRCAIYARYSSDLQSPLSIDDQIRMCREFAGRQGWFISERHIYTDAAISGTGSDRPGVTELLRVSFQTPRQFDILLVDDTSRLSRRLADAVTIFEKLKFAGFRIVAVSQGIDSSSEQADVLMTVHGLVDSLYIKELAKKTHRGQEGKTLRGLHTGGRCFGYDNVRVTDGVELQINEAEAEIVRRIFRMSADGSSLKAIARQLNAERIPPARPRAGKRYATWCTTAIHAMLRRELYVGRIVWNRSKFVKAPGSNKRLRRARPESEWRVTERPELRIIDQDLWRRVQERIAYVKKTFGGQRRQGLLNRSVAGRYLLSGFLKCGVCGGSLIILCSGASVKKYACSQNIYRGTCTNNLREPQRQLEERLLAELQAAVLRPEILEYVIGEFSRQLSHARADVSAEAARIRERRQLVEGELERLVSTAAAAGPSDFLVKAIGDRERELRELKTRGASRDQQPIEGRLAEIRRFVADGLRDLPGLLYEDVTKARTELGKHLSEITMEPQTVDGERFYVATGSWNLLGRFGGAETECLVGCGGVQRSERAGSAISDNSN